MTQFFVRCILKGLALGSVGQALKSLSQWFKVQSNSVFNDLDGNTEEELFVDLFYEY
jgi:hypothetical protein